MLNPTFPRSSFRYATSEYTIDDRIFNTLDGNQNFDTGPEFRLQPVYGEEIALKLSRSGLTFQHFKKSRILEVCGGSGFLAYHLHEMYAPNDYTFNDISSAEMNAAQLLLSSSGYNDISWALGDMHSLKFERSSFDIVIGNSFLHHFHNLPQALSTIYDLLKPGGLFISLHEPTPMSTVVEGAKLMAYPIGLLSPILVNEIAPSRYVGPVSSTDIWMFHPRRLRHLVTKLGFSNVRTISWGLFRPIVVQITNLHLNSDIPRLRSDQTKLLRRSVYLDSIANKILPSRFFGSFCLACRK